MRFMFKSLGIAVALAVLGLAAYGGWALLTDNFGSSSAIATAEKDDRGPLHQQMHEMMDAVMGEGFSERMHATMPGSEEMMEQCAQHMEQETGQGHDDMMGGGMMSGGMMGGDMMGQ